jgi:hypothetical protein
LHIGSFLPFTNVKLLLIVARFGCKVKSKPGNLPLLPAGITISLFGFISAPFVLRNAAYQSPEGITTLHIIVDNNVTSAYRLLTAINQNRLYAFVTSL